MKQFGGMQDLTRDTSSGLTFKPINTCDSEPPALKRGDSGKLPAGASHSSITLNTDQERAGSVISASSSNRLSVFENNRLTINSENDMAYNKNDGDDEAPKQWFDENDYWKNAIRLCLLLVSIKFCNTWLQEI